MRRALWMFLFAGMMLHLPQTLRADVFDGLITAIYNGGQSLRVTATNEFGDTEQGVALSLRSDVGLAGVRSLRDLQLGDFVTVEGEENFQGYWEVQNLVKKIPRRPEL